MPRPAPDAREILDVTQASVLRHGVAKASTNHIARAAGVSKVLLHLCFASRDALLDALIGPELARQPHVVRDAVLADDRGPAVTGTPPRRCVTIRCCGC
ncbi:AcrR family transcriptional regulator [Actinoalloteichus hoggarensis]|uniref:Transcriptional regulator, TetR family n=1 Tax=Actinoalloteichus hoggarensis TaxID=1470176 RepID=A0A221W4A9_9PSEU|nr:TetR/AcrR family transcriptional regulator [Actinoalloteichus hoggarensis]ASO20486.1 Transcriptional regulator, TetR family [Actinoalloteichus hoggarensis]MBB5923526.1 AcrR family transcriptional regulator [Actinoalloteichus hoggarensis]